MKNPGTFLGRKMAQTKKAIWLWEQVLSSVKFSRIIEIGTLHGALSHYFKLFADTRRAVFITYDIKDYKKPGTIRPNFILTDVFETWPDIAEKIQQKGITVLFCDGGDKAKELNLFAPFLKAGDIVGVHDWKTEIFPEDIPDGLEEIFVKECEEEGMLKFFRKND